MKNVATRALLLVVVVVGSAAKTDSASSSRTKLARVEQIDAFRRETWRWQTVMGERRTRTVYSERRSTNPKYHRWVLRTWRARAQRAKRRAARPPHRSAWLCIHSYEGPWHAATGNGYYGGLQMDIGFQRTYGFRLLQRKGTANLWTPLEQMWVAERAYRAGRGFYPWPNAARACGLL